VQRCSAFVGIKGGFGYTQASCRPNSCDMLTDTSCGFTGVFIGPDTSAEIPNCMVESKVLGIALEWWFALRAR
jgi:hypothetical protein